MIAPDASRTATPSARCRVAAVLRTRTVSKCSMRSPRRTAPRMSSSSACRSGGIRMRTGAADELRRRYSRRAAPPRVARLDDAVQILRDDRVVGRFDDGRQIGLRPGAFLLRDVASDLRSRRSVCRRRRERVTRQRHVDGAPVLGESHGLEVLDSLSATDTARGSRLPRLAAPLESESERIADQLGGLIAEDALGGGLQD